MNLEEFANLIDQEKLFALIEKCGGESANPLDIIDALIESEIPDRDIRYDRISTPVAYYNIETGPLFMAKEETYITTVSAHSLDLTQETDPIAIASTHSYEEAQKNHDFWRRSIMDTPPLLLKDQITGELVYVNFNNRKKES